MSILGNINNYSKPYPIGIIGGGQLALMLVEAAKERDVKVCVQTKSSDDPAALQADKVIHADPLQIKGNKNLIKNCEKVIFENEWVKIEKLKQFCSEVSFIPNLDALNPLVDRISQKRFIDKLNLPSPKWLSINDFAIIGNFHAFRSSTERFLKSLIESQLGEGKFNLSINLF